MQNQTPVLNSEQHRLARRDRNLRIIMPTLAIIIALGIWEGNVPNYLIPAPSLIGETLIKDGPSLMTSMWFTVKLTLISLLCAIVGGVLLGMIFALSRPIEMAFFPFAVILQVTPVIAIAPLILIYVRDTFSALLICAWIVAFFPILSNTVIGLRSADHNLRDLFKLYRASPWQRLRYLADRCSGGRICCRQCWPKHGPGLAYSGIELPQ
jgi:NitT/TauT family transport system permease protein